MQKIKNSSLALMVLAMLCMQVTEALADCKPAVKTADKAAIDSAVSAFRALNGPYQIRSGGNKGGSGGCYR